jgi:hypothetical protein
MGEEKSLQLRVKLSKRKSQYRTRNRARRETGRMVEFLMQHNNKKDDHSSEVENQECVEELQQKRNNRVTETG